MIRLSFGAVPSKVVVRLGKKNSLLHTPGIRPDAVSCVWDSKLRSRPRRLTVSTRSTPGINPRMSNYHGRYLYA